MAERISDAEHAVMEVLWGRSPLTAQEVAERVPAERDWSANTVKTLLGRLLAKNIIAHEEDGRRYRYRPVVERADYVTGESRKLMDRLFGGKLTPLVAHLAERDALTAQDIAEIEALLKDLQVVIGWSIETLVATTLLMLLVLAIRGPVRRAFGPHIAYALWLLPVVRMALPPLPAQWREQAVAPVAAASDIVAVYVVGPLGIGDAPAAVEGSGFAWLTAVGLLWAAGAAAFLAYHLIAHRRHCATLLRAARIDRTVAEGKVRVIETDAAHGPLAFGVFRKYVAFPRDFSERYDAQERALALAHELGHHARGDLLANWVALVVLAIHWFNPVAWRAFRAFRADQEMACDALVLAGRAQALRHAYGRAIVKSAHGGAVSAACHLHTINEVKGRLRMLSKTQTRSPARIAAGLAGVSAIGLAALGLTASGTQAAETLETKVEAVTGVDLRQDLPAPPEAPPALEAPEAPEVPEAPEAPEAPERPEHKVRVLSQHRGNGPSDLAKDGKRVERIIIVHADGTREEKVMPDVDRIRLSLPVIENRKCGGDMSASVVENREDAGKRIMIICSDRIAHATSPQRMAEIRVLMGHDHALSGLRKQREEVENNRKMSAEERKNALWAIDQSLRGLELLND